MSRALFLLLIYVVGYSWSSSVPLQSVNDWGGRFQGSFMIPIKEQTDGWEVVVTFSEPVTGFSQWKGDVIKTSPDNRIYTLVNKQHLSIQNPGNILEIQVQGEYKGTQAPQGHAVFKNLGFGHDHQTLPPFVQSTGTKYDYDEIIMKSILFYEAQRSGKLPAHNRIPWRFDSALNDHGNNGEDLTGGWYDAGDHVKFGFPMSASTTMLEWGLLQYKDAYVNSGELEHMYDCIRWPLEWLLKCHTAPHELYVQVGDGSKDHSYWGRPENMTMERPAFKITESNPGSDIAAEYAAAMAAGYMVFKDKDPAFAAKLLTHSKQLYEFALMFKAKYSDSVNAASAYYRSNAYEDEMTWGAAWLYWATNDTKYLTEAEKWYPLGEVPAWGQSWDDKNAGNMVLLYKLTRKDKYKQDIEATFTSWFPGASGTIPYSPKGLAFRSQWGSLRYASNMAFMALLAADEGIHATEYRTWAKSQLHYALGDSGRSYVVGFGTNPPQRPHHRASSCPMVPAPCASFEMQQKGPNPHVLYGALVGGPGKNDDYTDSRSNYINNEVACDYNAGFQSAIAGLESLSLNGQLP